MLHGRAARVLMFGRREVDEPRAVRFAAKQAALDHDLEQLADARPRRRIGQLGANVFDRGSLAPVDDVHDLAFSACQVDTNGLGHEFRVMANYFAMGEYIRPSATVS